MMPGGLMSRITRRLDETVGGPWRPGPMQWAFRATGQAGDRAAHPDLSGAVVNLVVMDRRLSCKRMVGTPWGV